MYPALSSFDIATRLTGWCVGDGEGRPEVGAFEFDQVGADLGKLLDVWDRYLVAHFVRFNPSAVVYEAPILVINRKRGAEGGLAPGRTDNLQTIRKLYAMGAYLEFFCRRRAVPCNEVSLQAIKKELTGNRHADKDAMVAVAHKVGIKLPDGPGAKDAADAWGGWLIALRYHSPKLSPRWDKAIWSPRGLV